MDHTITQYKRCDVLKINGPIDHSNAHELEQILQNLHESGRSTIVLDMTDVDFIASAGWWVLIRAHIARSKMKRGQVLLVGVRQPIRDSMKIVGIGPYFKIYDDLAGALGNI
jgi:anti-sigma B factor antagonist